MTAHEMRSPTNGQVPVATADPTRPVRAEDAFDVGALVGWMSAHVGIDRVPDVRQFPRGASNLTYLLHYADRDLVLRRPPGGTKARGSHDMRREYAFQTGLAGSFPYVPEMVAYCDDPGVLGAPFYLMARVSGLILGDPAPEVEQMSPAARRELCLSLFDRLVELHGVDFRAAGLGDYTKGPGYVQRQLTGWSDRYRRSRTASVPLFDDVVAWLMARQPADAGSCVIHNDWRFDNVVVDPANPSTVRAVLDWEMATVGDPLMDLGGALAYWVEADDEPEMQRLRRQPSYLPGMLTRTEIVELYQHRTGVAFDGWEFYEVFGLFRLAVILQQINYRYEHGQTTNPAYAGFASAVPYLERRCRRLIATVPA
jgi:aminoglycoside phosphotransferase (APT) family kinase protein